MGVDLYDTVFHKLKDIPDRLPCSSRALRRYSGNQTERHCRGHTRRDSPRITQIMRNADKDTFTEQVAGAVSMEKPPNFEEIIAINRGELHVDAEKAIELEIGPNRCAVHHHG